MIYAVVLQFASGPRVDIVEAEDPEAAIADFAGRCLRQHPPASLPLLTANHAEVPRERLTEFLNGFKLEAPKPPPLPMVPVRGIQAAIRLFGQTAISGAKPEAVENARAGLVDFFDRYGVKLDFSDGRPE